MPKDSEGQNCESVLDYYNIRITIFQIRTSFLISRNLLQKLDHTIEVSSYNQGSATATTNLEMKSDVDFPPVGQDSDFYNNTIHYK